MAPYFKRSCFSNKMSILKFLREFPRDEKKKNLEMLSSFLKGKLI